MFSVYHVTPYSLAMVAVAIFALLIAFAAWRRRVTPEARYLAFMELAVAESSIALAFAYAVRNTALTTFWTQLAYPGLILTMLLYLFFIMEYTQHSGYVNGYTVALLLIIPVLTMFAVALNDKFHLMWVAATINPDTLLTVLVPGPWYWVFIDYTFLMIMAACVLLYRSIYVDRTLSASRGNLLLVATVLGGAVGLSKAFFPAFLPGFDLSPLGAALTGGFLGWGIYRMGLLGLVPIARAKLVDTMMQGMLVLDLKDRVIDFNPAAQHLLSINSQKILGVPVYRLVRNWAEVERRFGDVAVLPDEAASGDSAAPLRYIAVTVIPLQDNSLRPAGRMFVLQDITQRHAIEEALARANQLLQQQLAENQALQEKLRAQAIRDELTGLHNRRYLMEILPRELARSRRAGECLSVVMLDLDHLKEINDTAGHAAGDFMLQKLAGLLNRDTRGSDVTCRYGGDEFVVLLPNTTLDEARRCTERWRAAFQDQRPAYNGRPVHSTLSLGIACFAEGKESPDDVLAAADRALYMAKAAGRNCVAVWRPGDAHTPPSATHRR